MSIELKTKLGSIALEISGKLRNDKMDVIGKAAMSHLVFHKAAGKVFGAKGESRDAKFSNELAEKVSKGLNEVLGDCFSDLKIETSEYVKQESKAQAELKAAHDAGRAAGLEPKVLQAMFPKLYKKAAVESDEESVG